MTKILITGISGFLGSHIAEHSIKCDAKVIGLKRASSDTWRCKSFEDKIDWYNFDNLSKLKADLSLNESICIIHCAWIGVEATERNNWPLQASNIDFLIELLDLKNYVNIEKFIFLGSQAEYGFINGIVNESYDVAPNNAYGSIKLACLEILRSYAIQHDIKWLWLRIFSVFGEREDSNWLIPSIIKSIKAGVEMDFTRGEQKYAYLYANDFSRIVGKLIENNVASGIYNISSNQVRTLKSLIEIIRDKVNPTYKLNFGKLPYRDNQSMHIEGDITKLKTEIGTFDFTDFNVALFNTLKYYISN